MRESPIHAIVRLQIKGPLQGCHTQLVFAEGEGGLAQAPVPSREIRIQGNQPVQMADCFRVVLTALLPGRHAEQAFGVVAVAAESCLGRLLQTLGIVQQCLDRIFEGYGRHGLENVESTSSGRLYANRHPPRSNKCPGAKLWFW